MKFSWSIFPCAFLFMTGMACGQKVSLDCSTSVLPQGVSKILESSFADWRIRKFEDLDAYDQTLWEKNGPKECPGITSGNFLKKEDRVFALLLVPKVPGSKGYKVVVFSSLEKGGKITPMVVEDVKDQDSSNVVIYRVPPGVYREPEETTGIQIKLDGIQVEKMEVGTMVYFWKNHRFEKIITSE
jgi:hypothetical protein